MESFSCFLEILEDFQTHLKGTFLDIFLVKGYRVKDVAEKSFTTYIFKEWGLSIIL